MINKKQIISFARKIKEPFYLYDSKVIRQNCRLFNKISYKNKLIAFAVMSNNSERFLKIIKKGGCSVFVNSLNHLNKVLHLGFNPKKIVFTSSAMSEDLMKKVNKIGCIINLDSTHQIGKWFQLFPDSKIGIRCNLDNLIKPKNSYVGYFIGKKSRLGLTKDEIILLRNKDKVNGLHLYPGTNIFNVKYFERCYLALLTLVVYFPNLDYIDLGSGFGIDYRSKKRIDINKYSLMIKRLLFKLNKRIGKEVKLILEPGRIIGANSAFFVTKVNDVKIRGKYQYVGVNASTSQFPRPLFYQDEAYHSVSAFPKRKTIEMKSSIYGCSTYSKDYFIQNIRLPKLKIGDIVVFSNAGSYCSSMFTEFLGFDKPKEIFL